MTKVRPLGFHLDDDDQRGKISVDGASNRITASTDYKNVERIGLNIKIP